MSEDELNAVARFVSVLGTSQIVATTLVAAGVMSIEEVAYVPIEELREMESLDQALLEEVRAKARLYLAV